MHILDEWASKIVLYCEECKENGCELSICHGECGCKKCYDDYMDFLSWSRD